MRKIAYILSACALSIISASAQDTVLNRNVTVEREFQPVIQSAGKVDQKPTTLEVEIEPAQVSYSEYSSVLTPDFNLSDLQSQPTKFTQGEPFHGLLRGAIGHPLTLFDFEYRVDDQRKSLLDVYAHHHAQWGRKANSLTNIGFDYTHQFSTCDMYFGVDGGNHFYTRYGRYYEADDRLSIRKASQLKKEDKTTIWSADVHIGVKANKKQDFQYLAEVGYKLYHVADMVSEHRLHTRANMEWTGSAHHGGLNFRMDNMFYSTNEDYIPKDTYRSRHALRMEPFYAYYGKRFTIHLGVNLDLNIGKGQQLSNSDNISFAPSPNIFFEAQIAKEWVTLYGKATGSHGRSSIEDDLKGNPYYDIAARVQSEHVSSYTPVDAELGFHLRPQKNLLMEIHAGYAYMINATNMLGAYDLVNPEKTLLDFNKHYADYMRFKVGAAFSYHYQDIVTVHLWGDYLGWKSDNVYDRPSWELGLRVDGRIDRNWSLYSDNHFAGSRQALVINGGVEEEHKLKPSIDVNLGCKYEWPELNLEFFLQLNNIICRHNDIFYGYQSLGINGLAGVTWRF